MAKEVENNDEPSQSSSSLPPLAENEVELVIERFWRDTRPKVCVRSETKRMNGFSFRLLVWPQGSKQSQSHISAFVEVVPDTSASLSSNMGDTGSGGGGQPAAGVGQKEVRTNSGDSSSVKGGLPPNSAVSTTAVTTASSSAPSSNTSIISRQYPPDWATPCVFYRISIMNFKSKYPYSKADTWTFSYVCPDRGWHTLLDTKHINRRDGYLNNDGSLVIRAIVFPRFTHPISVLPLWDSVTHEIDEGDLGVGSCSSKGVASNMVDGKSSSTASSNQFAYPPVKYGLANILATDPLNCLLQSLFHLPGFRRFIYSIGKMKDVERPCTTSTSGSMDHSSASNSTGVDSNQLTTSLDQISASIDSCSETVQDLMDRVMALSVDLEKSLRTSFLNDCQSVGLCHCGMEGGISSPPSTKSLLIRKYGRCKIMIACLEEALYSISNLFCRPSAHRFFQLDAYRKVTRDCRRLLTTVAHPLFEHADNEDHLLLESVQSIPLISELQLLFAKMEFAHDSVFIPSVAGGSEFGAGIRPKGPVLLDTRGVVRALGGWITSVSPESLAERFFEILRMELKTPELVAQLEEMFTLVVGSASSEGSAFSIIGVAGSRAGGSPAPTTIEKGVSNWLLDSGGRKIAKTPKVLTVQLLFKVKDRMDVPETLVMDASWLADTTTAAGQSNARENDLTNNEENCIDSAKLLVHECRRGGESHRFADRSSPIYQLHSIQTCSGADLVSAHYSVIVRNNRVGSYTRFDDAWSEEFVEAYAGGNHQGSAVSGGSTTNHADWVFSPEWSCTSVTYVREDAVDEMYCRGVDVRLDRPDVFRKAVNQLKTEIGGFGDICAENVLGKNPVLCNRVKELAIEVSDNQIPSNKLSSPGDVNCQVEILLVTEKDVIKAVPGGYSVPFTFSLPNVTRRLVVRKDILVDRLMQAVGEHFKIPINLQRLFALRYYPETNQERFELMHPHSSIVAHLASGGANSVRSAGSGVGNTITGLPRLYVLVSGKKIFSNSIETTVWVKVFDESKMALVSVAIMGLDSGQTFEHYFESVWQKWKSGTVTEGVSDTFSDPCSRTFAVFEELGPRQVQFRRSNVPIREERVIDGDILVFVPLTPAARAWISSIESAAVASTVVSVKRRLVVRGGMEESADATATVGSKKSSSVLFDTFCCSDESEGENSDGSGISSLEDVDIDHPDLKQIQIAQIRRTIRHFRAAESSSGDSEDDEALIDIAEMRDPNKIIVKEKNMKYKLFEHIAAVTGSKLNSKTTTKKDLFELMSEFIGLATGGGTVSGPVVPPGSKDSTRPKINRMENHLPQQLREEMSRVVQKSVGSCPKLCFYCQLPFGSRSVRVLCTHNCYPMHPEELVYHERCLYDLIKPNGNKDQCVITVGCEGALRIVDQLSISGVRGPSVAPSSKGVLSNTAVNTASLSVPLNMSGLRHKLGSVFAPPKEPIMTKNGTIEGKSSISSDFPQLPPSLKKSTKSLAKTVKDFVLPLEPLWWNACLTAFGNPEKLLDAVETASSTAVPQELKLANAIFLHWCEVLLEKHHPWRRPAKVSSDKTKGEDKKQKKSATKAQVAAESPDSEDEESADSPPKTVVIRREEKARAEPVEDQFEGFSEGSDGENDFDWKSVVSKKEKKKCVVVPAAPTILTHPAAVEYAGHGGSSTVTTPSSMATTPQLIISRKNNIGVSGSAHIDKSAEDTVASVLSLGIDEFDQNHAGFVLEENNPCKSGGNFDINQFENVFEQSSYEGSELGTHTSDNVNTGNHCVSSVETNVPSVACSLLDEIPTTADQIYLSRMGLLPLSVRNYCLPTNVLFVYHSNQFNSATNTLSLVVPFTTDQINFINTVSLAAFQNNCGLSRLFASPQQNSIVSLQTAPDVQWFVECNDVAACTNLGTWAMKHHPEWKPETGALLPASVLGFSI